MSTLQLEVAIKEDGAWETVSSKTWTVYEKTEARVTVNDSSATFWDAEESASGYDMGKVDWDLAVVRVSDQADVAIGYGNGTSAGGNSSNLKIPKGGLMILVDRKAYFASAGERFAGTRYDVELFTAHTPLASDVTVIATLYRTEA